MRRLGVLAERAGDELLRVGERLAGADPVYDGVQCLICAKGGGGEPDPQGRFLRGPVTAVADEQRQTHAYVAPDDTRHWGRWHNRDDTWLPAVGLFERL